jgi:hypothetical protein
MWINYFYCDIKLSREQVRILCEKIVKHERNKDEARFMFRA